MSGNSTLYLSGNSAGGLATVAWADYIKAKMASKRLYAIPDSGYFNDVVNQKSGNYTYRTVIQSMTTLVNQEVDPPNQLCVAYYPA